LGRLSAAGAAVCAVVVATAMTGATAAAADTGTASSAAGAGGAGPIHEFKPFPIPASFSCEVTVDNQGNLWSDQFTGNAMAEVNPATGAIHEVPLPNPGGAPGGENLGPDGNIWFVEVGGNALGKLNPRTRTIKTIPFPWANVEVGGLPKTGNPAINNGLGVPFDDSFGTDGGLWFTMIGLNAIGRYDLQTHKFQKFQIPTPVSGPIAMERGPGDTIAFTEGTANKIGLINVHTHKITEYPIPTPNALPGGLTTGPNGKYVYFGETLGQKIGRLDPETGKIKEYDLLKLRVRNGRLPASVGLGNPLPSPGQLRFGSDGKLYIMEGTFDLGNQVGQLNVNTGEYHELSTPTPFSSPCDLNNEIPGKIIFGEFTGNRIAYFDIPGNSRVPKPARPLYTANVPDKFPSD
jgi:virginiamycin B lyase